MVTSQLTDFSYINNDHRYTYPYSYITIAFWLFNIAMEISPCIEDKNDELLTKTIKTMRKSDDLPIKKTTRK